MSLHIAIFVLWNWVIPYSLYVCLELSLLLMDCPLTSMNWPSLFLVTNFHLKSILLRIRPVTPACSLVQVVWNIFSIPKVVSIFDDEVHFLEETNRHFFSIAYFFLKPY